MKILKDVLVYGGFLSFVCALVFQYLGMHTATIVACFLFAPGYFISMNEMMRARHRRAYERGYNAALQECEK